MMTETQKRVARAQAMLDSGMYAKAVARECGYKNVNGMMGAIALHGCRRQAAGDLHGGGTGELDRAGVGRYQPHPHAQHHAEPAPRADARMSFTAGYCRKNH